MPGPMPAAAARGGCVPLPRGRAVDVANGVAVDVDAVDDLVDSEQATSANMIVTTSSVVPQRITRDRCAGSCVNRERVQSGRTHPSPSVTGSTAPQPLPLS